MATVNLGIWSPKSTCRSTPDSDMDARRITPPLEPSLSMAKARAVDKKRKLGGQIPMLGSLQGMMKVGLARVWGLKLTGPAAQVLTISSELQTLFLGHSFSVCSIDIAIDVGAPRASNGKGLSYHHTPHGH